MARRMPMTLNVEYRPVVGIPEEFFRVGDDGSLWTKQKPGVGAGTPRKDWRRLAGSLNGTGYLRVSFKVQGVTIHRYIHRIVLEAFVGPCPPGLQCRHLNGIKADNRLANLCWGTVSENRDDEYRNGARPVGSSHPWARLTEADILAIRQRLAAGDRVTAVAAAYEIDRSSIRLIRDRKTWKHAL
jgi:hypothetical protein